MSLNPHKCAIAVQKGKLLGHIISKDGMSIDSDKIIAIQRATAPGNLKAAMRFIGQTKWHSRYLRYLADVCAPLSYLTKKDVSYRQTNNLQARYTRIQASTSNGKTPCNYQT